MFGLLPSLETPFEDGLHFTSHFSGKACHNEIMPVFLERATLFFLFLHIFQIKACNVIFDRYLQSFTICAWIFWILAMVCDRMFMSYIFTIQSDPNKFEPVHCQAVWTRQWFPNQEEITLD